MLEVAANKYGAKARLLELRKTKLPLYNPSIESTEITNGNILEVTEAVIWADAFVPASPDYHGSMSGTMKNFLDYFWKEFAGKTFGYLCTSHEKGLTVMDQMCTTVCVSVTDGVCLMEYQLMESEILMQKEKSTTLYWLDD